MDLHELSFPNSVSYYLAGNNGKSNKTKYFSPLAF